MSDVAKRALRVRAKVLGRRIARHPATRAAEGHVARYSAKVGRRTQLRRATNPFKRGTSQTLARVSRAERRMGWTSNAIANLPGLGWAGAGAGAVLGGPKLALAGYLGGAALDHGAAVAMRAGAIRAGRAKRYLQRRARRPSTPAAVYKGIEMIAKRKQLAQWFAGRKAKAQLRGRRHRSMVDAVRRRQAREAAPRGDVVGRNLLARGSYVGGQRPTFADVHARIEARALRRAANARWRASANYGQRRVAKAAALATRLRGRRVVNPNSLSARYRQARMRGSNMGPEQRAAILQEARSRLGAFRERRAAGPFMRAVWARPSGYVKRPKVKKALALIEKARPTLRLHAPARRPISPRAVRADRFARTNDALSAALRDRSPKPAAPDAAKPPKRMRVARQRDGRRTGFVHEFGTPNKASVVFERGRMTLIDTAGGSRRFALPGARSAARAALRRYGVRVKKAGKVSWRGQRMTTNQRRRAARSAGAAFGNHLLDMPARRTRLEAAGSYAGPKRPSRLRYGYGKPRARSRK